MANYLQWRGATWHFRIGVPHYLRPVIGKREICATLGTCSREHARAVALSLAGQVLALFAQLQALDTPRARASAELFLSQLKNSKPHSVHGNTSPVQPHLAFSNPVQALQVTQPTTPVYGLHSLIAEYLQESARRDKPQIHQRNTSCLTLFADTIGDVDATTLKQRQINDYLRAVQTMPERAGLPAVFKHCKSVTDFVQANYALETPRATIGEGTYHVRHFTPVSMFLDWCRREYGDDGFPSLVADIAYEGDGVKLGETGARAFTHAELRELFESPEMATLALSPDLHEKYWLMHLGLYSGARINELLLINPLTDIQNEDGVPVARLTVESEKAPNIHNSIKNEFGHRVLPVHQQLLNLGFLAYVQRCRDSGFQTLFPSMSRYKNPASEAGKWVTQLLKKTGVYDATPRGTGMGKGVLTGFHSFRDTFITAGHNAGIGGEPLLYRISGHKAPAVSDVVNKHYAGEISAAKLKEVIDRIGYSVEFFCPELG